MPDELKDRGDIRETVRERYAEAARAATAAPEQSGCGCGPSTGSSCCGADAGRTGAAAGFGAALYDDTEAGQAPEAALRASLGCGVPTAVADLHEGETVLDLGSGAGADVLISARRVGPTGKVIGLDMTDEMLALARANAAQAGIANAEFVKGYIEAMPLPDASVDVVISNCVINLSADKPAVLREVGRVLRPGGRFAVSDVVADDDMDEATRADMVAVDGLHRRCAHSRGIRAGARRRGARGSRDHRDPPCPQPRRLGDRPRTKALTRPRLTAWPRPATAAREATPPRPCSRRDARRR